MSDTDKIVSMNTLGVATDLAVEILKQSGAIGTHLSETVSGSPLTESALQAMCLNRLKHHMQVK